MSGRMWLDRLLAALDDIDDQYGDPFIYAEGLYLGHLRARVTDDRLLTMRRVRLRSAVLARIERAGAAFSINHALKRAYSNMRMLATLTTPLLSSLKRGADDRTTNWGGTGMYWDVVTKR